MPKDDLNLRSYLRDWNASSYNDTEILSQLDKYEFYLSYIIYTYYKFLHDFDELYKYCKSIIDSAKQHTERLNPAEAMKRNEYIKAAESEKPWELNFRNKILNLKDLKNQRRIISDYFARYNSILYDLFQYTPDNIVYIPFIFYKKVSIKLFFKNPLLSFFQKYVTLKPDRELKKFLDDIKQEKERLLIREANSQDKEIIPVYKKDAVFNFFPDFRLHLERFKANRIIFETNTGFIWNIDIGCFVHYLSEHAKHKKHPNYSIIATFFSWLDNNEIIVLTTKMLRNNNRGERVKYSIINDIIEGK